MILYSPWLGRHLGLKIGESDSTEFSQVELMCQGKASGHTGSLALFRNCLGPRGTHLHPVLQEGGF